MLVAVGFQATEHVQEKIVAERRFIGPGNNDKRRSATITLAMISGA
jgi:hypothetical protein